MQSGRASNHRARHHGGPTTQEPPLSTFIAGWNQPGYLPEVEREEFDTFEDARQYLLDTVDRWLDEDWEEPDVDSLTADDIVNAFGWGEYKGYNLWVEEIVS